jgi:hypothetical protein
MIHVCAGYYNDTIFHRSIRNFMIQVGGQQGRMGNRTRGGYGGQGFMTRGGVIGAFRGAVHEGIRAREQSDEEQVGRDILWGTHTCSECRGRRLCLQPQECGCCRHGPCNNWCN